MRFDEWKHRKHSDALRFMEFYLKKHCTKECRFPMLLAFREEGLSKF